MNSAFSEHAIFYIPIDAYTENHDYKKPHHVDEDPNQSNQSLITSCDDTDFESKETTTLNLSDAFSPMRKSMLVNSAVNVFFQCFNPSTNRINAHHFATLIRYSMGLQP